MQEWKNVEIGLLRPSNVAHARLLQDQGDSGTAERDDRMDSRIAELRTMFEEAAETLGVKFAVTEYQLFDHENHPSVPSGKRGRNIIENDILVTYDPSPLHYNFATRLRAHPLQRAVVAFSDRKELMDVASFLGAQRVPLIQATQELCVQRIFALHLPLNDDVAAAQYRTNLSIVMNAMRYPDIQPQEYTGDPDALKIIDENNPLSKPEGRGYMCELP